MKDYSQMKKLLDYERNLSEILKKNDPLAIAFSGGLDSTLLAKFADSILNRVLLVHVSSPLTKKKETLNAVKWAKENKIELVTLSIDPLKNKKVRRNPEDRCYHCKKVIFKKVLSVAKNAGIKSLADGTNKDDFGDFRPGMKAAGELGVIHPLAEAGLGKKEIRILSKKLGITDWKKPAAACLATRIPYGTALDIKTLDRIEACENLLEEIGIRSSRVRAFGDFAVIETAPSDFHFALKNKASIIKTFKKCGFRRILLDVEGYRTGSLNHPASDFQIR